MAKSFSKVEAPNYKFSLDELENYMPGKDLKAAQTRNKNSELLKTKNEITTHRFLVAQTYYKFPVIVQVFKGKIIDMYAKLPSYFLHDLFHQSLINRYGKQDQYFLENETAIYKWKNISGNIHLYSGACTIICFTIFYSVTRPKKN